ncbi:MAG: AAA family ATPase [Acidobacteriota bacterium]
MQCSQCGFENAPNHKFCVECGHRLTIICHQCGAENAPSHKFCAECGVSLKAGAQPATQSTSAAVPVPAAATPTPVASPQTIPSPPTIAEGAVSKEGERKQATVLYCELVAPAGPEGLAPDVLHALLNRFFELAQTEVERYGGTVSRFLGQGVMALFGAPITYEDHPRRAVLAALGLVERLKEKADELEQVHGLRWSSRMGLDTGAVVVGGVGGMALGQPTTIAALLQQRAQPGDVLVSGATARLVRAQTDLENRPAIDGPNGESIETWRVVGRGTDAFSVTSTENLTPFVGRDHELSVLEQLREQASQSRGQVVGIAGDAGAGKSRMLHEFYLRTFPGRQVAYLRGQCLSYGAGVPYLPLADMIRKASRIAESDDDATMAVKLRKSLELVGTDIEGTLPFLLRLVGASEGTEALDDLEPQAIQARTFTAMRRMLLDASRRSLVVVEIEDLHWMDTTSAAFLDGLVEAMAAARLLVILTYRSGYQPHWVDKSYATQLTMRPLSTEDSRRLVEALLEENAGADGAGEPDQEILAKAEGNPFFLEEMARAMAESSSADGGVPDTIQGILMSRIDRLPEVHKQLLLTASILGREMPIDLLTAIWEQDDDVEPLLEDLQRWELIYRSPTEDQPAYLFKHALTQEVTYQSLVSQRRKRLHARAAEALEQSHEGRLDEVYGQLTYHYPASGDAEKTVYYLTLLAQRSARDYAHKEAAKALREALEHVSSLPEEGRDRRRVEVLLLLADSLLPLAGFPETLELFEAHRETMEALEDPSLSAQYLFWLAHTHTYLGNSEATREFADRSISAAKESGDEATEGKACYVLGRDGFWSGQFADGIRNSLRAVVLLERAGAPWWQGQAYWVAGFNHYALGQFVEAIEALERALRLGEALDDYRLDTSWSLGYFYASLGDAETGIEQCRRGLERSQDPLNTAVSRGFLGHALTQAGQLPEAIEALEGAVAMMRGAGMSQLHGWFAAFLGEAYLANDDLERARASADEGLTAAREGRFEYGVGLAQLAQGRIAAAEGRSDEARTAFAAARGVFETLEVPFEVARTRLDEVRLGAKEGLDVAADLQEVGAAFEELRVPFFVDRTAELAADLGLGAAP